MEKKKPGPPLGYKKRKNSNSSNPSSTTAEKKVRKSDANKTIADRPPHDSSPMINNVRPPLNHPANRAPTVTIRANPIPLSSTPSSSVYQGPLPNAIQPPPPGYQIEYLLKDPSASIYPYGRPLFPEMSLGSGSPGSPFSMMYYSQYSPDCVYTPQPEMSLPASPSACSPLPPTIPTSPVAYATPASATSSPAPSTPSASSDTGKAEASPGSPGLEITLPALRRQRVDPDRFLATASTYAQYMDVFQKMYKDDALGIFTFVDIPPLEYIFPLAGMSREGKLHQIMLFTVLGLGALSSGNQKQSFCLGESGS